MAKKITLTGDKHINQWIEDTPGCSHRIHLNNAGAALMPSPVVNAIQSHIERETYYGGYEAAEAAAADIAASYEAVADLIGTDSSNVAFVENATAAVSQALSAFNYHNGDVIITTNVDYSSNQIMLLSLARRFGISIVRAADLAEGGVDPDSVHSLIRKHRPRLLMMSWVPTNSGLVQDAQAVGRVCRENDIPFLLDACQAVGQLAVDVETLHCDFLAATARKFLRGPRGLGFLYVSDRMLEKGYYPLFPDTRGATWTAADHFELRDDSKRFENWEFSYALVLGLGAAAKYALNPGIEMIGKRARELAAYTREELSRMESMRVLDRGRDKCAIVTVEITNVDARKAVGILRNHNINTSATMRHHGVIDMDKKKAATALRISPHCYNRIEDIDRAIEVLRHHQQQ